MKNYLSNTFDLNKLVGVLDELPLWSAPFGLKLLDKVEYKPGTAVLDIGFGTGFPLIELAMRFGSGSIVYGIDPWKEASARALEKIRLYGVENIKIIEGRAEEIPLNNESVDLIVSNNGLNNVGSPEKALSECSRVIKSGGQFIQTMNLDKSMFEFYGVFERVLSDLSLEKEIGLMHRHIYEKRRPLDEIISLIQKNRFIIKDLEHDQFCYKFTDGSALLNHYFIRLAFMSSWVKILPENKREKIFEMIEARLNEQSEILGGIKLSIPFVLINAIKV